MATTVLETLSQPETIKTDDWFKKCFNRPDIFARYYFPHYFSKDFSIMHYELIKFMRRPSTGGYGKRIVVAAPRGHGKSTIFSFLMIMWWIAFELKKFIVIVSDTEAQATLFLSAVKEELENNQIFKEDFGDLTNTDKWTEKQILTKNRIRIIVKGTGSKIRGARSFENRPDGIICDDLENQDFISTAAQRNKIDNWFHKVLLNIGDKKTDVFVVGTILSEHSLLNKLLANKEVWEARIFEAIDSEGKILWEAEWSAIDLQKKKNELGKLIFDMEFRNKAMSEGEKIFPSKFFRYFDYVDPKDLIYITMGVDPAVSEKERASFFAVVTLGVKANGEIFILAAHKLKLSTLAQADLIIKEYIRWNPNMVGIENVAYQGALKGVVTETAAKAGYTNLPIKLLYPDADKVRRALRHTPSFENGYVYIQAGLKDLIEDLQEFPITGQDLTDAMVYAMDLIPKKSLAPMALGKNRSIGCVGRVFNPLPSRMFANNSPNFGSLPRLENESYFSKPKLLSIISTVFPSKAIKVFKLRTPLL